MIVSIIKQEVSLEVDLKTKIDFICSFLNTKPTFISGSIRTIERTNLTYLEPHRIIIKNITFLAFNYSKELYIENLNTVIEIKDLEEYLKTI